MDVTKMGMIQLQNPCHPTGLLHKANQMRLAGTLCDVVIMVDSQEFHAHRTVLACTSKMFEILFHRNSQHYTLDFLSPKTFQQILEYAYTATLQARVEDLDDLLYAAEILEIEYLEEQCLKILETIQASDDNDTEVTMTDGGAEDEEDRKSRYLKSLFISKHSSEESGYTSLASQSLAGAMVEQSPSVSTSFGLSTMSPTKAAVDSLMTIGQSLLQGALQQSASEDLHSTSGRHPGLAEVKTEVMQVEEGSSHESPRTAESSASGGGKPAGTAKTVAEAEGQGTCVSALLAQSLPAASQHEGRFPAPKTSPLGALILQTATPGGLNFWTVVSPVEHLAPGLASPKKTLPVDLEGRQRPRCWKHWGGLTAPWGDVCACRHRSMAGLCGWEQVLHRAAETDGKLHSGMKTYGCELCGKRFLDSLRLRMHLLAHSAGAKAFVCDQCGAQFSKEDALETHRQTHTEKGISWFLSQIWSHFWATSSLWRVRFWVQASSRSRLCPVPARPLSCSTLCKYNHKHLGEHGLGPRDSDSSQSLLKRLSGEGGGTKPQAGAPQRCQEQAETFSNLYLCFIHRNHLTYLGNQNKAAMIKHLRTHNGASPYQCTICLEYCPSLSAMQKHMKGHKPEEIPTDWRIEKTYLYLCYV
ncbi:Zinc finger and BTB domain-containing protein 16 [Struthio camelus australis]|uniref:Zinc finger and BTB domain-containing protein 16 n=1 Tax=Struthio camelus australis TaxID=441894 RepID=A0A093HAX8_STRCA|nr:Zinc finger and BTB domain-containing protein 16 [Struthio camelus australis]